MTEQFKNLALPGIAHFISTKPYNLAEIKDREQFLGKLGIPFAALTTGKQVHGTNVYNVKASDRGRVIPATDGLITNIPGICLMVVAADCVPVLLFDKKRNAVGAVHAGWRGTVSSIVKIAVEKMRSAFSSDPKDILAGIGPSIGKECYEVGKEVVDAATSGLKDVSGLLIKKGGATFFDLKEANRRQLIEAGVPASNIEVIDLCTYCRGDLFFSARREGRSTGRFGAGIMLKNA